MGKAEKRSKRALSGIPWGADKPSAPAQPPLPWQPGRQPQAQKAPKPRQWDTQALGNDGETRALRWLERHGLALLARNHRCRCGELDLIMAEGDTAVIVEVRLRNNHSHGTALDTVNRGKIQRIERCAKLWWVTHGQHHYRHLRFDVVALHQDNEPTWLPNAWLPES